MSLARWRGVNGRESLRWKCESIRLVEATTGIMWLGFYINTEDTETGLLITARSPASSREKIK